MLKYIAGVLLIIGLVLSLLYFFVGVPKVHRSLPPVSTIPYIYNKPNESIGSIQVLGLYFVPANRIDNQIHDWQEILKENLQELKLFHETQFLGLSQLTYEVYPIPLVGLNESTAYETVLLRHTNSETLQRVAAEIDARVFHEDGDSFSAERTSDNGAYRVIVIMYEGVGATGSSGFALVSRNFLTHDKHTTFGASFIAHEFYHALGVPDRYELQDYSFADGQKADLAVLTSDDIMGKAQVPLHRAFLDRQTLKKMGL